MENSWTSASVGSDEAVVLCPGCGYDLRGMVGGRCSECGLEVDREALRESGVPWAHRGKVGTVKAYVRTVWWVTVGSRRLAYEAGRPQEVRDGRRFRWVTAGVVGVTLVGAWAWVVGARKGLEFLAYQPATGFAGRPSGASSWVADVMVPWSAGATMAWVVPACLVMLAVYLAGVQQAVFRVGALPAEYRRRAGVIAYYAAGPLALLLPALACLSAAPATGWAAEVGVGAGAVVLAVAVVGVLTAAVAVGGTVVRVGQWVTRVRHGGVGVGVVAAAELVGLWVVGAVVLLGVVPWCVGFLWVIVDSFR